MSRLADLEPEILNLFNIILFIEKPSNIVQKYGYQFNFKSIFLDLIAKHLTKKMETNSLQKIPKRLLETYTVDFFNKNKIKLRIFFG